ncbi:MAG: DNA-directed RNA polymerase subunit G [Thermoprotei archaeon]|nr:DNA-directed RNA polymerase subunit G [Thermoprotei archaeon]
MEAFKVEFKAKVEKVRSGNVEGQRIASCRLKGGGVLEFDVIGNLIHVSEGDELKVVISEEKPSNLDAYEFCGHGYIVAPESKFNATIFSMWGIIFRFSPPVGLELDKKYYLCMKH